MRSTAFALSFLAVVLPLLGQGPTANVTGRVVDGTGAVIPGVAVRVTNLDTSQSYQATANDIGTYTIPYLNPGRYAAEATSQGFRAYRHSEFTLDVDQSLRLDITMEVGAPSESVTVTAALPALNTENGERGDVTSNAELTEMPLNGRNFGDLAYLTGGVIPKSQSGDGQYSVNGARSDNVGFLVDGLNNTQRRNTAPMVTPSLEGLQEFKVITSGFSAEYGRYAGGQISAVTKSGGNRFRGSLYEFLRNDIFDARNFFAVSKSKLRQNQFGATLTGPVLIPKLYSGKDRTFFLFSWESLRQISGQIQRGIVPTPQMLAGTFSRAVDANGKPETIVDPLAKNAPFPGNIIPSERLDPVAAKIAAYYPAPNLTGSANNYLGVANSTSSPNKFTAKVDQTIGSRDRISVSTHWTPTPSYTPFVNNRSPIAAFAITTDTFGILSGIRYIHTFTPTMINEASASFSRYTSATVPVDSNRDWAAEVGFVGASKNPGSLGLPYVTASGYIDLGQAYDLPKIYSYNNYQYANSVTWIHGRHTVKLGGDFLRYQYFSKIYSNIRGQLSFLGRFTTDPMADLTLGYLQTSQRLVDVAREYLFASNYSAFAQDDFKITPNLTLNFGLRYELMKPPVEKYGARSTFVPDLNQVVAAGTGGLSVAAFNNLIQQAGMTQYVTMASDLGLPQSLIRPNYKNLAPRFGFAWRPFGNARSVIRGGYGIFYGTDSLYRYDALSNTYPFSVNQTFTGNASNPLALTTSNPFPSSLAKVSGATNTKGQDINAKTQYLQSWNVTLERDLGAGNVLTVAYAASKGTHLPLQYNLNQQVFIASMKLPNGTFPRPYSGYSDITYFANIANSIYNSGSATLRHQLSNNLFIRATYTYGKSLDYSSQINGPTLPQDARDIRAERGRSDFDVGHSLAASLIWRPNFSRHFLVRDWQLSGVTTAYTGQPFTPTVANFNQATGGASRPDRIAKGTLPDPSPDAWFDRSAFPPVPAGSFRMGNAGRNILDGPGTFSLNAGLSRRFRFSETRALQFRLESFNLMNRANFQLPQTNVDVLNGGVISIAKDPRQLQLGLRLEF